MDLNLTRKHSSADGIFSELRDLDENLIAITLEHAYPAKGVWFPKIPKGEFTCVRGIHRLKHMVHDFTTFEVLGVPGHTNLLFHVGNYNFDSDGCILVGEDTGWKHSHYWIKNSLAAFTRFMSLQTEDQFNLKVI